MEFDLMRRQLVLFGGVAISADFVETPLCDTWHSAVERPTRFFLAVRTFLRAGARAMRDR